MNEFDDVNCWRKLRVTLRAPGSAVPVGSMTSMGTPVLFRAARTWHPGRRQIARREECVSGAVDVICL